MNTFIKSALIAIVFATSVASHAQWSGNIGWVSDYLFRGIFQSDSSAYGGIDYEQNGFYIGTWAADVDDGLEIDGYFGYGGEYGDFSYGIGFTGYYYTGNFDDTYQEINVSAGYGPVTVDAAFGDYENFNGPTQDYTFFSITAEHNGFYGKFGSFSQDLNGDYFEFGYGTTISELDVGLALVIANDDLVGANDDSLVFSIGKSFQFGPSQ
ncbi:MAG: hypothetical protein HKN70_05130 [Gammaproteobacteria bacterium]|nr:hypothetical protein [Gammaproteobacteria bacterium]